MAASSAELAAKEYPKNATALTRLTIVRAALAFLIVGSFVRALERSDTDEHRRQRQEVQGLLSASKRFGCKTTSFSLLYPGRGPFERAHGGLSCEEEHALYEQARQSADMLLSGLFPLWAAVASDDSLAAERPDVVARVLGSVPNGEWDYETLLASIATKVEELQASYAQDFHVEFKFLDLEFETDLRRWIFWLPFIFVLSEIYFGALRSRLTFLMSFIRDSDNELTKAEFGSAWSAALYVAEPDRFLRFLANAVALGCGVRLLLAGIARQYTSYDYALPIVGMLAAFAFYARAYVLWMRARMLSEVPHGKERGQVLSAFDRIYLRFVEGILDRATRYRPRLVVTAGGALVCLSLVLPLGVSACGDTQAGYALFAGAVKDPNGTAFEDATPAQRRILERSLWITAAEGLRTQPPEAVVLVDDLGKGLYGSCLLLALAAAVVGVVSWRTRRPLLRLCRLLAVVNGAAILAVQVDLIFGLLYPTIQFQGLWGVELAVIIAVAVSLVGCYAGARRLRDLAAVKRLALIVVTPAYFFASVAVFVLTLQGFILRITPFNKHPLWGIPALLIGAHLVSFGLWPVAPPSTPTAAAR